MTVRGPEGAPTIVFVHGLGLSAGSWEAVMGQRADDHRIVAYDLRGHGRSGASAAHDYGISAHAADLDAVLSAVVVGDEGAVLVGHSLGGAVILARAERSLEHVSGVVFVCSAGSVVTVPGLPGTALPRAARQVVRRLWLLVLQVAARVAVRLRRATWLTKVPARWWVFTARDPSPTVDRASSEFLRTDPDVLARTALASVSDDGSRPAPRLRVPALVLHGDRDKQAGEAEVRKLLARLPDGRLVTLRGAGHMLPTTDSAAVAGHVAEWVDHVAGRGPQSPPAPQPMASPHHGAVSRHSSAEFFSAAPALISGVRFEIDEPCGWQACLMLPLGIVDRWLPVRAVVELATSCGRRAPLKPPTGR